MLKSERVTLRALEREDLPWLWEHHNDYEVDSLVNDGPPEPQSLARLEAEDVRIRLLGDVAIIHAATRYTTLEGQDGRGRYTDVWQKRGGTWLAVSAHVTRL